MKKPALSPKGEGGRPRLSKPLRYPGVGADREEGSGLPASRLKII
jgi:hypothetical protein